MPEGVEVRISSDLIKPIVKDRLIIWADPCISGRYGKIAPEGFKPFQEELKKLGKSIYIEDVSVKGKFMYWTFTDEWYMFCTFGMTGQWSPTPGNHPCFFIHHNSDQVNDGQDLYFNDPRHFGTIKFVKGRQKLLKKLSSFGWDPLNDGLTTEWVDFIAYKCIRKTKPIGELLMDQKIFAGVGNYIRAEALYLAKISPWRQANLLTEDEMFSLCHALTDVMNESYKHQGATILTYKDAYGAEGKYSSCFKVYGQKKDPLGNEIKKEDMPKKKPTAKKNSNIRTIHWCPEIQK